MSRLGPTLRRTKVRERPLQRAAVAFALSTLLNAAGLALLARAGAFDLASPVDPKPVALTPLSAERWEANRSVRPEAGARRPPTPTARGPGERASGQIVDVAPPERPEKPKDARFASEHDVTVERETRSRHARAGYERTLPVPVAPGDPESRQPGAREGAERERPGAEGEKGERRPEPGTLRVAAAGSEGLPSARGETAGASLAKPGVGEGGARAEGDPDEGRLIPPGTMARIAGGPAPDHLPGVEEGDGTYLNTRSFKYATYFNRIKQAVAAAWDPLGPFDARDPDRSIFGRRDRFTLLGVTLDDTGRVKSLVVEETSGIEFLDRAAIGAFEKAQPFVNPPRGVVDANGEIRFSFGFSLELGRSGLRIYRAPMRGLP